MGTLTIRIDDKFESDLGQLAKSQPGKTYK